MDIFEKNDTTKSISSAGSFCSWLMIVTCCRLQFWWLPHRPFLYCTPTPIHPQLGIPPPPQLYYSLMFFFFFLFSSPNRIIQLFPNFCFLYQRLREQKAIISLNHLSKKKKNEGKRKMKANLQYFVSFFFFFLFISFVLFCMRIYRRLSFL